jgi:chaperonin GroES
MRPMHDYVVIRRQPDKQIGSIIVPDSVDTKPRIGIVEAVGPGRLSTKGERIPMSVKVGDRVKFDAGAKGYVVHLPGHHPLDTRLLIPESGIELVLDDAGSAHALGTPWPAYIAEGPQDTSPQEAA